LCSSNTFSRTDLVTDSETFYNSVLELLDDPFERDEVRELLGWWDRYVTISFFLAELMACAGGFSPTRTGNLPQVTVPWLVSKRSVLNGRTVCLGWMVRTISTLRRDTL
jgi:hypothetical protein